MSDRIALVTNVTQYAGPAAAKSLSSDGFRVVCHDAKFSDAAQREAFAAHNPQLIPTAAQDPAALVTEARAQGTLDVLVSNDFLAPELIFGSLDDATLEGYELIIRELLFRPFQLIKSVIPSMKEQRRGRIILITSAAAVRPMPIVALYTTARAAATSLATTAGKAYAEFNIQVNSIGPNWFQNPTYFPAGRWEQDAELRSTVEREVPMKRLGQEEEMGALIAFLASGKALPVTGQFFGFTGGWLP